MIELSTLNGGEYYLVGILEWDFGRAAMWDFWTQGPISRIHRLESDLDIRALKLNLDL
jgi:hypothetical protein